MQNKKCYQLYDKSNVCFHMQIVDTVKNELGRKENSPIGIVKAENAKNKERR